MFVYNMLVYGYGFSPRTILVTTSIEEIKHKLEELCWPRDIRELDKDALYQVFPSFDYTTSYIVEGYDLNLVYDIKQLYRIFKGRR